MGPKTEQSCVGPFLKLFRWILAVVEDHAAEGVIDAVVEVVAELAAADGLADDLGDGGGGGGHQEPPRLGENLDRLRKQAVQFRVDRLGQALEGRDGVVVVGGEAAADVEQLELEAARLGLGEDARRPGAGPGCSSGRSCTGCRRGSSAPRLRACCCARRRSGPPPRPASAPNLLDSSTIEPVLGTRNRSTRPACGACRAILITSSWLS